MDNGTVGVLVIGLTAVVGLLGGCVAGSGGTSDAGGGTTPAQPAWTNAPAPGTGGEAEAPVRRRAVVAGLTRVDPRAYGGWSGACPGCDVDAQTFALLCREQGLEVRLRLDAEATKTTLVADARSAWQGLQAGDLFVLYVSGHGGQVVDTDGDEADGQDETLCLYDGEMTDDFLRALWEEVPAGVRVLFVTDTCNSGTNYRARPLRRTLPRAFAGALLHFGGCADGQSSFGSAQGGTFTTALIDGWQAGQSYRAWFDAAVGRMPGDQVPVYGEYGRVDAAFSGGVALR